MIEVVVHGSQLLTGQEDSQLGHELLEFEDLKSTILVGVKLL